jgi:signal transduction histidine kinase
VPALDRLDALCQDLIVLNAREATNGVQQTDRELDRAVRISAGLLVAFALTILGWISIASSSLARAARRNARLFEELDAFCGRVAHDLKNPLSAVTFSLAAVQGRGRLGEDVSRHLARASRACERATRLIDDLLFFARAAARPQPGASAALGATIDSALASVAELAERERVQLHRTNAPALDVAMREPVLHSILTNLLSNAILHMGDRTSREVTLGARIEGERVALAVEDSGPGIPAGLRLFQPFHRGPGSAGHGLGLVTVRRLVEAHGGTIAVQTASARGTTFTVRLPLAPPPPKATADLAPASASWKSDPLAEPQ